MERYGDPAGRLAGRLTRVGALMALTLALIDPQSVFAQAASIRGVVRAADNSQPLAGAVVRLLENDREAATNQEGRFTLSGIPAGVYRLETRLLGYAAAELRVRVASGEDVVVEILLEPRFVSVPGIHVMLVRPDLLPESELSRRRIRDANPRDPGELVRALPGVDAVRRGPVGLDPSVRALRETEVGAYVDGARTFPAGPARMDSQLGHVDPSAIRSIAVVKGPYALTWGAGNLAAIRIETQEVPPQVDGLVHGNLATGYDGNLNAVEASGSLFGRSGAVSYWAQAAWREGDDYESGGGELIPADFRSWEGRGKLAFELAPGSVLTFGGGYQKQTDIDYPGRLLNALFFKTANGSVDLTVERSDGVVRRVNLLAYGANVRHDMTNAGKPTALPNPDRTPPFALDVGVDTESTTFGGRAAVELAPDDSWQLEIGGDLYSVDRNADRVVSRQENGVALFEDLIWPDVRITDGGLFLRASRPLGPRVRFSATGRVDFVSAEAGEASDFFTANIGSDLDDRETNLSGAATLGIDMTEEWAIAVGLGSAVRTADALERFSDRFPASKAQIPAEFVGNPALDPERSTQADVWLEATYDRVTFDFTGFVRWIDNYITLQPTTLPKRLPLSPDVVFQYVNRDARFRGFETSVAVALTEELTASATAEYLWGEEDMPDGGTDDAFGVAPFGASLGLRYDEASELFHAEGVLRAVSDQDRVAGTRGETPTDGYTTLDISGGVRLAPGLELRGGALNVFDTEYVNHLNSKNPFSGQQIPEPGIVFFVDLGYAF